MSTAKEYLELIRLAKMRGEMSAEEKRAQRIDWAAGQCALSDREGRSLEWWMEVATRSVDKKEQDER